MNGLEILVPITAIVFGGMSILIPVAGLTARFALKPVLESLSRMRESQGTGERQLLTEQRLALLEEQLHAMERDQARLLEELEFQRKLDHPARELARPLPPSL